jgi:hypothetical protein
MYQNYKNLILFILGLFINKCLKIYAIVLIFCVLFSNFVYWSQILCSAEILCCSMYCLFLSFCVLFLCKCVLYNCQRVETHLQLTNISYQINKHESNAVTCLLLLTLVIKQYPHKQQKTNSTSGAVQGKFLCKTSPLSYKSNK